MKASIVDGRVAGSYVHYIMGQPVVFVHAGFRPEFLAHVAHSDTTRPAASLLQVCRDFLIYLFPKLTDFLQTGSSIDIISEENRSTENASYPHDSPHSAEHLVNHVNGLLKKSIEGCSGRRCIFDDEAFEAGPDRGGRRK